MMNCPFLGAKKRELSDPGNGSGSGPRCPFGFASKSRELQVPSAAEPPPTPAATKEDSTTSMASPDAPAASCPYGFKSSASGGQAMSALHCVLCKQWMHDPVQLVPCKHRYCAFCIAPWRDCPVCGCDIEGSDKDEESRALVDQLLAAHISVANQQVDGLLDTSPAAAPASSSTAPAAVLPPLLAGAAPSSSSSFLLHLGLQALRGGNPASALHRLEACKLELLQGAAIDGNSPSEGAAPQHHPDQQQAAADKGADQQQASEQEPRHEQQQQPLQQQQQQQQRLDELLQRCVAAGSAGLELPPSCGGLGQTLQLSPPAQLPAPLAGPLGAVYGSQGDAAKQLGALGAAAALYAAGATCLRGAAETGDDEAAHALSVSINKLGDVKYLDQELGAAHEAYLAALEVRRQRLHRAIDNSHVSRLDHRHAAAADAAHRLDMARESAHVTRPHHHTDAAAAQQHEAGSGAGRAEEVEEGMAWDMAHMHSGCVAQALDCAASLIKVADARSALGQAGTATQACTQADLLLDTCQRLLGGTTAQQSAGQGSSSGGGAGAAVEGEAGDPLLQQRCAQLAGVLQGMKQTLVEQQQAEAAGVAQA